MTESRMAANVMHFCRALRAAGLPVGTGRTIDAARAVARAGLRRRDDFYWTLHASLVDRRDRKPVFDRVFQAFWGMPALMEALAEDAPPASGGAVRAPEPGARRAADALRAGAEAPAPRIVFDAALTASAREVLRKRDFERMSAEEFARARRAARAIALRVAPQPTRRFRADDRGPRIDARRTLRAAARRGGEIAALARRRRALAPPPLVALCDISGSMGRYSRLLLHFVHALANDRARVRAFVFGTRLTDVSRHLRRRDPDAALDAVAGAVEDWSGGTRIGAALAAFNRDWSRRVLGRGAIVLLITDGLDRGAGAGLAAAMDRLRRSCRRLVWLNPLLRYEGFEPKASGVRVMLPRVDSHRPVHNLDSLEALADALAGGMA